MIEFRRFPKVPRWNRDIIVTEKIDGTNASVHWIPTSEVLRDDSEIAGLNMPVQYMGDENHVMLCGSRNNWITPDADNFEFAAWAHEHSEELAELGPGSHYGEWYGRGIQRGYGLDHRRFALFNVKRWFDGGFDLCPACCEVVPVLAIGTPSDGLLIECALANLETYGSRAVPGYMRPEGVVVYHTKGNHLYKMTIGDDGHKGSS